VIQLENHPPIANAQSITRTPSKRFHISTQRGRILGKLIQFRADQPRNVRRAAAQGSQRWLGYLTGLGLIADLPEELGAVYRFMRLPTRSSTTAGSAKVEVSPSWSCSLAAILRRMRRMILPERVFGRLGAH
jgi:hypothetical protein